jgi:hypothetical protein
LRRLEPQHVDDPVLAPDPSILNSILAELRLDDFEPLLCALPRGLVDGATGPGGPGSARPNLLGFVREVSELAAANPLLYDLGLRLSTGTQARAEGVADGEVYELVHYCFLLDAVTRTLAADPELAALVYSRLHETVHCTPCWRQPLGLFELSKMCTVEMTLERFIEHRRDRNLPGNFGQIGLPVNILEAVLQDLYLGFLKNAAAGVALSFARPGGASADHPGAGAALSADRRRVVRMHLPHEQEWKDLYVSWNLAFTTAYTEAFTNFGAPLMLPCVLGAPPAEFMFHRVLALHVHMCLYISRRATAAAAPTAPLAANDCRRRELTEAWGAINLEAAQRYEKRLRMDPLASRFEARWKFLRTKFAANMPKVETIQSLAQSAQRKQS